MPHEIKRRINNMSDIKLSDFFGFCLAEITTTDKLIKPILLYKYNGKTIFPKGTWISAYTWTNGIEIYLKVLGLVHILAMN